MNTSKKQRMILVISTIAVTIFMDQLSKIIVRNTITTLDNFSFVNNSLILKKAQNTGAALGLGGNLPSMLKTIYFQILPIAILLYFLRLILTKIEISKRTAFGLSLSIGGAIANLNDRVIFGSVTDFIQIQMGSLKSGIFNIADIFIVSGAILVVLELVFNKKNNLIDSI